MFRYAYTDSVQPILVFCDDTREPYVLMNLYVVRHFISPILPLLTGIPIRTTMDNSTTVTYAGLIHQLTNKTRCTVRDIDPQVGTLSHTKGVLNVVMAVACF